MTRRSPPLIDSQAAFQSMLEDVLRAAVVGLDAEMDSYFSYFPKLCLMQVSTPGADYLVDTLADLDLSGLGQVTANPEQVKIFHAGANDVPYFRKTLGYEFVRVFDTHVAARVLGMARTGLAPLLEEHFGVELDKQYQRADWRLRPLPPGQAEYARLDTRYLLPLREQLLARLEEEDKLEEARSEFEKICYVRVPEREFDPEGWARLKGVRELARHRRGILCQLYAWREEEARELDIAVFRVLPDGLLLALASRRPRNRTELLRISRHPTLREHADELLACIEEGSEQGGLAFPERQSRGTALSRSQQRLYDRLRQWRNQVSAQQELEPDRVASNRLLRSIAEAGPGTPEELGQVDGMEPWRFQRYGDSILEQLRRQA